MTSRDRGLVELHKNETIIYFSERGGGNGQFIRSDGEGKMKVNPGIGDLIWSEEGASAVEYSVLLAFIAGLVIALIFILGGKVQKAFSDFVTKFSSAQ